MLTSFSDIEKSSSSISHRKGYLWISYLPRRNWGGNVENSLAPRDRSRHGVVVQDIGLEKFEVLGCVLKLLQMGGLPLS